MGSGHIENPDEPAAIESLFKPQLIERIGRQQTVAVLR